MAQNQCRNAGRAGFIPRPQLQRLNIDQKSIDHYESLNYTGYQSLLFLSDGGKFKWQEPMGLSQEAHYYATDFEPTRAGDVAIDNTKLPFRPDSFDFILMNRGICLCCGRGTSSVLCGGIKEDQQAMKDFILSVSEVLVTSKPGSLALFTGYSFPKDGQTEALWIAALQDVAVTLPYLEFGILNREKQGSFIGFYLASPGTAVQSKIKQLLESGSR